MKKGCYYLTRNWSGVVDYTIVCDNSFYHIVEKQIKICSIILDFNTSEENPSIIFYDYWSQNKIENVKFIPFPKWDIYKVQQLPKDEMEYEISKIANR